MDIELMNISDVVMILSDIYNVMVVQCVLLASSLIYTMFHNAVKK